MFTHIHTNEWMYNDKISTDKISYFVNFVDGRIMAEMKTDKGNEYYYCTDAHVRNKLVGNYIGCVKKNNRYYPNVMVYDHDKEVEHTISLNDEEYLK